MTQLINLSRKQSRQVNRMYNEFQSYLPFKESTFHTIMGLTLGFLQAIIKNEDDYVCECYTETYRTRLKASIDKYYINGFKLNKRIICYETAFTHCRMINPEYGYTKLETVVVMKTFRAFRDYGYSGFKNEDEFIDKLVKISNLLK